MRSWLAVTLFAACLAGCGDNLSPPSSNTAPTTLNDQAETPEDQSVVVDVLANDTDADDDALAIVAARADGGAVEIVGGAIRVTPPPDFFGEIRVDVEVSDGDASATSETVVTVTPVNDAPTALAGSVTTGHDGVAIGLTGEDVDGDALAFEIVGAPGHGTLEGTAPEVTYVPAAGYVGADALSFIARDGHDGVSAPATIAITVTAGTSPVATAQSATTAEDTDLEVQLVAEDADGDALTYQLVETPAHGSLTGTAPNLTYIPYADYHGPDSFAFTATDGVLTSTPAQVSIEVTPVNDAPLAVAAAASTDEDAAVSITLTGSDVDGDALTFTVAVPPARGTLALSGATALYTPSSNSNGADAFTFTVSDGTATSAPAAVQLLVAAIPDAPVALAQSVDAVEDTPLAIGLVASDVDGDELSFTIIDAPAHGTVTGTPPALTYTPAANYHGGDTFTWVAGDGSQSSAPATMSITVAAVNDAPTAASSTVTLLEDRQAPVTLGGADVEGDPLTYTILVAPENGTLTGSGPSRTYTPVADTNGNDSLTYQVSDGLRTASATVTLAVTPVNDPPVARDDVAVVTPGVPLTIRVVDNDDDVDGDVLTVIGLEREPAHGDVELVDGDFVYTADVGYIGNDSFDYNVRDSAGLGTDARVRVGVGRFPTSVPTEHVGPALPDRSPDDIQHDLSDDGRFVVFLSLEALVADDTNGLADVYVFDRVDGGLERVSVSSAGVEGDGDSGHPSISGDGRHVAFTSTATGLVDGDTNDQPDVFVHDRITGITIRVSVGPGGAQGTGPSSGPEISADGMVVAFSSLASELVTDDTNGASDVFVRDLETQTTTRVSVSSADGEGDGASDQVALSADGHVIAFRSIATNLVDGDANGVADVIVRDLVAGTTSRASVSSAGVEANGASRQPSLSEDGRLVLFLSRATNLDGTGTDFKVLLRDRQASTTTLVDTWVSDWYARISGDGRYVASQGANGIMSLVDLTGGEEVLDAVMYFPMLSRNGRYIAALGGEPAPATGMRVVVMPNP